MLHVHITLQSREFSIQNPILHAEGKELFEYYTTRNSTHRRQGDLLEMHPCVLQDLPVTFQAFSRKSLQRQLQLLQLLQRHSSLSRHSSRSRHSRDIPDIPVIHDLPAFPGNSSNSTSFSISRESTPFSILRLECIFYILYNFYSSIGFHRKLHRVPVGQLQTLQTLHSSKKGRCCDIGQIDRFSIIELFPLSSCQVIILIARMTFNCFSSCLMS